MSDDRPTQPPDPNTTPADVLRAIGSFKKELFTYLDNKEIERDISIDAKLAARDDNVLTHVRELRDVLNRFTDTFRELCTNVNDLTWWRGEFRRNRHGIKNAFVAIVGAIGELKRRVHLLDGQGADVEELNDLIARALDFQNNDPEKSPPSKAGP